MLVSLRFLSPITECYSNTTRDRNLSRTALFSERIFRQLSLLEEGGWAWIFFFLCHPLLSLLSMGGEDYSSRTEIFFFWLNTCLFIVDISMRRTVLFGGIFRRNWFRWTLVASLLPHIFRSHCSALPHPRALLSRPGFYCPFHCIQ